MMKTSYVRFWVAAVLLVVAAGGKKDEPRLATPPASPSVAEPAPATQTLPPGHPPIRGDEALPPGHPPLGGQGAAPAPSMPSPTGPRELAWDLPKGWSEARGSGMRYATLKPGVAGLEVSVVVLSGAAGGELGNVNRWRGQVGLPPMDEAARARARESVRAKVGEVSLYDFVSGGELQQRMLAGLLLAGDQTWFFKLTGGAAAVGAAKPDFVKLLTSLRTTGA